MSSIRDQLNVWEGMEIRECGSLDEAVLWCYRHDCHPIGAWPDSRADPDHDLKVRFALPHLEDYLNLILKEPQRLDVPAYARALYPKMIAESEALERYPDGSLKTDGVASAVTRFRSESFDIDSRDYELSIYPFAPLEIDVLALDETKIRHRSAEACHIGEAFESYFPRFCDLARQTIYPSHKDDLFDVHATAVVMAVDAFVFSNPSIPDGSKCVIRSAVFRLASWAVMLVRPRVEGEEI